MAQIHVGSENVEIATLSRSSYNHIEASTKIIRILDKILTNQNKNQFMFKQCVEIFPPGMWAETIKPTLEPVV